MRSIDERLIASDPATQGYAHPDFGAMVTRVVATPVSRRDAAWQSFRLKVAAAVTVTGVLTGAGIAALSAAGVALPVLSFAASAQHQTGASTSSAFGAVGTDKVVPGMYMPIMRNWQFTGSDNFSSAPGSATVYTLSAPSDPAATLSAAASALGVNLATPTSAGNGQDYLAPGPAYSGWISTSGGFSMWGIGVNNQPGTVSSSDAVAPDSFNATALADARKLGTYNLGAPTATALGTDTSGLIDVTVPILVGGRATDFLYDFTFAVDGSLVSASGVSFTLTTLGDYPLISPAAGVDQINAQLYIASAFVPGFGGFSSGVSSTGAGSSGSGVATPPTVINGSSSAGSAPADTSPPVSPPSTVDSTTTTLPPVIVNLTDVTDQYGAYAMSDGSTLLLPLYVYAGDIAGDSGPVSFRVIPVDPAYLNLSMAVRPQIY